MMTEGLSLFGSKSKPDYHIGWEMYERGLQFHNQIDLENTVRVNENFYVGKQWEGVESNGLPTPVFNDIKRVVGFITATITTDNIKCTASALANTVGTSNYKNYVNIVNDEFEALTERNSIPSLVREFTRNAAVDGSGCIYTYWDAETETGQEAKGAIKSEIIDNVRVFFGNPNSKDVQSQPWIIISKRSMVRDARKKAKANGVPTWRNITNDSDRNNAVDSVKLTYDKCTELLLLWRDDDTETIWAYEFCQNSDIKAPYDLGIKLYPIVWLPWDYVKDSYEGQAMITGLIPNQVFINKAWAMCMLSIMKSAFPKYVYDKTKIKQWDNRVGSAIGTVGDVNSVAKVIDPATISPQVSQLIQLAVDQTEQSLGATKVAMGDTRPDNTSAIVALQRAAATPHELTKQNLYRAIEDLYRIYLEYMGEYYGERYVDVPPTEEQKAMIQFAQMGNPNLDMPDEVPMLFDFAQIKEHPMTLKLDVGASTYYSEIASIQTMDNLLREGHITILQYLERIPDDYVPGRRALIEEVKKLQEQQQMMMQQQMGGMPPPEGAPTGADGYGTELAEQTEQKMGLPEGSGYGQLQRALNAGQTEGIV